MSLADELTTDCTIVARRVAATRDRYGNEQFDETTSQTVCELQQRAASEDTQSGSIAVTEYALFLLPSVEVAVGDAVVVDGDEFEVTGVPWQARDPRGDDHIEATVVRTAGAVEEAGS